MTSQVKAFQWSLGIHILVILGLALLSEGLPAPGKTRLIDLSLVKGDAGRVSPSALASLGNEVRRNPGSTEVQAAPMKTATQTETSAHHTRQSRQKSALAATRPRPQSVAEAVGWQPRPAEEHSVPIAVVKPPASERQRVESTVRQKDVESEEPIRPVAGLCGETEPYAEDSDRLPGGNPDSARAQTEGGERASAGNGPGGLRHSGTGGSRSGPEYTGKERYLAVHFTYIRDLVTQGLKYPAIARMQGWEGTLKIGFVVCEDGRVEKVRVLVSSGFGVLDKNAVKTVLAVAPFPRPPEKAEIILPITYRLN